MSPSASYLSTLTNNNLSESFMYGYQQNHPAHGRGINNENVPFFERSLEYGPPQEKTILEITSGYIVAIDQFMLANGQFVAALPSDGQDIDRVREAVCNFGGCCFEIENGTLYVTRDAYQKAIVASQEDVLSIDDIALKGDELFSVGKVFVDTRCVVLCDVKILFDSALLEKYAELRARGGDKPARDLLRENGCAVRYGFMPYGDEFTAYVTRDRKAAAFY